MRENPNGVSYHAENVAKDAGAKGVAGQQARRETVSSQVPVENVENVHATVIRSGTDQLAYDRVAEEAHIKAMKEAAKPTQEQLDKWLNEKITKEIKARKDINEGIIDGLNQKIIKDAQAQDIRWRNEYMGRVNRQKMWWDSVYHDNDRLRQVSQSGAAQSAKNGMNDEQWTANMPQHISDNAHHRVYRAPHAYGFVQEEDDELNENDFFDDDLGEDEIEANAQGEGDESHEEEDQEEEPAQVRTTLGQSLAQPVQANAQNLVEAN